MPKVTIIDGNNEIELSTIEDNIKAFMVKGEPGSDGISPTAVVTKTDDTATLSVTDKNGTTEVDILDGFDPTITASKSGKTTTITITDIDGTRTTEIEDGLDLTGGVPTDGVIGWTGEDEDIPNGFELTDPIPTVVDSHSTSSSDGYSASYLNDKLVKVSNEVDEDYRVNFLYSKNLFDKNTTNIINGAVGTSAVGSLDNNEKTIFIKCEPNTTYTISKIASSRFRVATTTTLPTNGTSVSDRQTGQATDTTLTYTTNASAKYLLLNCWSNNDTSTFSQVLDSIQIEEGNEATTYEAFVPNSIVVDNEKYTDTLNVDSAVDSRSRVNFIYGNLFDNSTDGSANGTYLKEDGTGGTGDSNLRITNYIPIDNTKGNLIASGITSTMSTPALCFYDSNKTFISGAKYDGATEKTFVIPSNASYFKTSYRTTIASTFFIKYTPSIVVDNEEIYSKPVVLWENSSPTSDFASGNTTLNDNLSNYSYYEILYLFSKTENYELTTGKIETNRLAFLGTLSSSGGNLAGYRRLVSAITNNILTFSGASIITATGTTGSNTICIPYKILGYK